MECYFLYQYAGTAPACHQDLEHVSGFQREEGHNKPHLDPRRGDEGVGEKQIISSSLTTDWTGTATQRLVKKSRQSRCIKMNKLIRRNFSEDS